MMGKKIFGDCSSCKNTVIWRMVKNLYHNMTISSNIEIFFKHLLQNLGMSIKGSWLY